jgi:predicted lipoprotein with Yx(FWY)xxD motif
VSQFLETDARERSRARARIALAVSAGTFAGCTWFAASPMPVRSDSGVLVNAQGRTLYTFDRDAHGKSACNAQCAVNWPPLHAAADAKPARDYTIIARDDGTKQWAHKGKPLYLWSKDANPGDRTGDGVDNLWRVARP